jgi:hypothetical protein
MEDTKQENKISDSEMKSRIKTFLRRERIGLLGRRKLCESERKEANEK